MGKTKTIHTKTREETIHIAYLMLEKIHKIELLMSD